MSGSGTCRGGLALLTLVLAASSCLSGCLRGFFSASGTLASEGGTLGHWRSTPIGCTRTPFDGARPGQPSTSVATLLWKFGGDPAWRSRQPASLHVDEPLRLELSQSPAGPVAAISTVLSPGATRLDGSVCSRLQIESRETPAAFPEGRPALAGHVALDCQVGGGRVAGELRFSGCTY